MKIFNKKNNKGLIKTSIEYQKDKKTIITKFSNGQTVIAKYKYEDVAAIAYVFEKYIDPPVRVWSLISDKPVINCKFDQSLRRFLYIKVRNVLDEHNINIEDIWS